MSNNYTIGNSGLGGINPLFNNQNTGFLGAESDENITIFGNLSDEKIDYSSLEAAFEANFNSNNWLKDSSADSSDKQKLIDKLAQDVANGEGIYLKKDENGKLVINPKFKDLDAETLNAVINKAKTLKSKDTKTDKDDNKVDSSSAENQDEKKTDEKKSKKEQIAELEEQKKAKEAEIKEHKANKPDKSNEEAYNAWKDKKDELEAEKKLLNKQIKNLKPKSFWDKLMGVVNPLVSAATYFVSGPVGTALKVGSTLVNLFKK